MQAAKYLKSIHGVPLAYFIPTLSLRYADAFLLRALN
jgi:hypothetical protein